ncbi:putative rad21/Rec8-like protein [Rosa chinensis]|uniref:Putative rad21/Rec8-like protein n=1 Tax=Rosa chinensis TaxID=74649 RepID=A0A2P6S5K1_ROSCH|nr:putative rad21/Rec8-like protein [Rosa chinensis]
MGFLFSLFESLLVKFSVIDISGNNWLFAESRDKILKDDWDVIAYRVLAYLLLGVVRIYSKKVEYLFDVCHEVLTEINKFVVSTKEKGDTDTFLAP